jgi:outer membrane protein assembly factor BamC
MKRFDLSRFELSRPAFAAGAVRVVAASVALASLAGCDTLDRWFSTDHVDYKNVASAPSLDVPPGLNPVPTDNSKYIAPPATTGLGGVPEQQKTVSGTLTFGVPNQQDALGMHVEQDGKSSWLVVDGRTPEQLWPQLKEFWQANGFNLKIESPSTGVMETDWAENRAKIPNDWFRNSIGKLLDGVYSSGTQDKFRTLIERGPNGTTDIFFTHHGMVEVNTGQDNETTRWQDAPRDPRLEVAFMEKLMQKFGLSVEQSQQLVAQARTVDRVQVASDDGAPALSLKEPFDRAWLHVGLALDRSDFAVSQADKAKGVYYVNYVDPASETQSDGILSKLFGNGAKAPKVGKAFMVSVHAVDSGTQVDVLGPDGSPVSSAESKRLMSQLHAQLD